ncbi:VOC family protein [Sphingomonas sp. BT-65]|uniref:VOC family protein n=1 Tax=Sphingomonas sp. BT-65 TaxID=2989821 RepID=UPI002236AF81|nr:VOC family protein [Sphingomonas sp. BT-65]MCW4463098.1 VOC family protein [Sphingomonas sp. BT-65]
MSTKSIFINLPVRDLAKSTAFYEALGFTKNDMFSDDNASSMMWSENIVVMLLVRDYYSTFTTKPIADAHATSAMLIALSQDSREAVDAIVEKAGANGGQADVRAPQDLGFMYGRSFADPDGNVFEPMWMNPAGMGEG